MVGGFGSLLLVTSVTGWVYFSIVNAVWAILTALLLVLLKKNADEGGRRKLKVAMALVMLIPALAGAADLGWFVWAMTSASW